MKVSKTKGLNPRVPVFGNVHSYRSTIGNLLSHMKIYNTSEISPVRKALTHAANAVYEQEMKRLRKLDPGIQGTHLEKVRYCDSVSALKTSHAKMINKICRLTVKFNA